METNNIKTDKLLTITEYCKLFNISRKTVYNWIKEDRKDLKLLGRKGKQLIKVPISEIPTAPVSTIDFNEEGIKDLSVSDLASLCTMYKLSPSHDSFSKLTVITSELDKRLTNIFI